MTIFFKLNNYSKIGSMLLWRKQDSPVPSSQVEHLQGLKFHRSFSSESSIAMMLYRKCSISFLYLNHLLQRKLNGNGVSQQPHRQQDWPFRGDTWAGGEESAWKKR